jgi:hypothetical protein
MRKGTTFWRPTMLWTVLRNLVVAFILLAGIGLWLAYTGAFYPTGAQYYEACWEKRGDGSIGRHLHPPRASDPYKDVLWNNCEPIAQRAIFNAGMLFGLSDDKDDVALRTACPDAWQGGTGQTYFAILDAIQSSGGPSILDKFTPTEWMVGRLVRVLWPECDAERRKQGYPKMVEIKPGEFDWERACTPCAIHKQQREEEKTVFIEKNKAFWEAEKKRWSILPPTQVELRDAQLKHLGGVLYEVSGQIRNKATVVVTAVALNVVVYDCATNTTQLSQCEIIGRALEPIFLEPPFTNVPPGQVRRFNKRIDLNWSTPLGVLTWKVEAEKVRVPLDPSDETDELHILMHSIPWTAYGREPLGGGSLKKCCL